MGPTPEIRREVAQKVMQVLKATPDVADVGTYMEQPYDKIEFRVDRQKAKMFGVTVEDVNRELIMATGGFQVGALHRPRNLEQAVIVLQVPLATRVNLGNLLVLPVRTQAGVTVPFSELGQFTPRRVDPPIYRKDLRPLEYVTADVVGRLGAPLYGMLAVDSALKKYVTPDRQVIGGAYFGRPDRTDVSGFKWDGEWEVTYVTFRDMGVAFMAALVLIYVLVVAEFRSFLLPLVVMAPIPLTMIGIVPGHWLLGADFTATSMIGFIALAGIIVRNSILLVEFAREKVSEGMAVQDAVTLAGRVRLRPILITALALVIGSMVLLSDPIFQGMAVSLCSALWLRHSSRLSSSRSAAFRRANISQAVRRTVVRTVRMSAARRARLRPRAVRRRTRAVRAPDRWASRPPRLSARATRGRVGRSQSPPHRAGPRA